MVQSLRRTCVISRRTKKSSNSDMTISDMKVNGDEISFLPPANGNKDKQLCTHVAKLYNAIDNKIVFSRDTEGLVMEFVLWDTELQGRGPRGLPEAPLFAIGVFPADKPSLVSHRNRGSIYMCEKGIVFRDKDNCDEYYTFPSTSLCGDDQFASIGDTSIKKMQLGICKEGDRLGFYINGSVVCKIYQPACPYFMAIMTSDRRLCSIVLRADKGRHVSAGNLWKISELSAHKRAHYRDVDGTPYTHGAETVTNDLNGALYEELIHREYAQCAEAHDRTWLVPRIFGILNDGYGPVLCIEHIQGKGAREMKYYENWVMTGVLCDVVSCGNIMYQTRIVHEDFFLRNFVVSVDGKKKETLGTMIDFDRMRCMNGDTEQDLSRWIVSTLLAFMMELAYMVFNVSGGVNPAVAHTLLRVIDIFAEDRPIYMFKNDKFVPNWKFWCVWYEGEHECNDMYYFSKLHGTNLKYRIRDDRSCKTISYTTAMKTAVRFLSYQVYLDGLGEDDMALSY